MPKYHISEDGNPRVCRASKNPCRFGGSSAHYSSKDEARGAYEVTHEALLNIENESSIREEDKLGFTPVKTGRCVSCGMNGKQVSMNQLNGIKACDDCIKDAKNNIYVKNLIIPEKKEDFNTVLQRQVQEASRDQDAQIPLKKETLNSIRKTIQENESRTDLNEREARSVTELKYILQYEAETEGSYPDYDLEAMSPLTRMKNTLKAKYDYDDEDFKEMTFLDIESEYLDTYGEPEFRPTEEQDNQDYQTRELLDELEYGVKSGMGLTPEWTEKVKQISDTVNDDSIKWMSHKPLHRKEYADRFKAGLKALEKIDRN